MNLLTPPYVHQLDQANSVLIAGAGGGFDIFCGLPLYFNLVAQGKTVYLANFSFTYLDFFKEGKWLTESMMKVTADLQSIGHIYFPELYLAHWFRQNNMGEVPIYTFAKTGVIPLYKNYQYLVEQLQPDTIILVDGGTDSLMRGDEDGLGTPGEDFTSLAAVSRLNVPRKMLLCLGFGVDHYHGVSNDLSLQAISQLTQSNDFLGSTSILPSMPEAQLYKAAAKHVFQAMPEDISIVSTSIISALDGHYGNHHTNPRTRGSKLWINPLMSIYWFFDLDGVSNRNLILDSLLLTETFMQVVRIITHQRQRQQKIRKRNAIPN